MMDRTVHGAAATKSFEWLGLLQSDIADKDKAMWQAADGGPEVPRFVADSNGSKSLQP